MPYADMHKFIAAIRACDVGLSTQFVLEFIALTVAGSGRERLAVWPGFDLENDIRRIPVQRMKAQKMHRVPLAPRSIEILRKARGLSDGDGFVLPGTRKDRPLANTGLSRLVKELGFNADVHGLRTSFRNWTQERTDYPREVCEFALAHVIGDAAERACARPDLFEKRLAMMNEWAAFLLNKCVASKQGS